MFLWCVGSATQLYYYCSTVVGISLYIITIIILLHLGPIEVSLQLTKLEEGFVGISAVGKDYLVVAYGKDATPGLLRGRLLSMSNYFAGMFEQVSKDTR